MRAKTHLKGRHARAALGALDELLARCPKAWGVRGGAFVADGDRLRLEILTDAPAAGDGELALELPKDLGGGLLRLEASPIPMRRLLFRPELDGGAAGLAPGSSIYVRRTDGPVRAGVACFVQASGGPPQLLTCGHAFEPGAVKTAVNIGTMTVANLSLNLLESDSPIDGALCTLTKEGQRALALSSGAQTWTTKVTAPRANDSSFTFWPSHDGASDAVDLVIDAYPASRHFYGNGWDLDLTGLVRAPPSTQEGDSGSIGIRLNGYYCLCTGLIEYSYFTPITAIVDRLNQLTGGGISIWQPEEASALSSYSLVRPLAPLAQKPNKKRSSPAKTPSPPRETPATRPSSASRKSSGKTASR